MCTLPLAICWSRASPATAGDGGRNRFLRASVESEEGESGKEHVEELFYSIEIWLEAAGPWALLLAPLLMAVVAVLPFPAELPAMVNGMLFGPWLGSAVTWLGALAGAQASFELARRLGRPMAERLLRPGALQRADELVERAGWWGMLLPRFVPLIAFTALNWGAGLTPVSRWRFFWTTAVGIVPGALLFSFSGAGLPTLFRRFPWVAGALALALLVWGTFRVRRLHPSRTAPDA